MRDKKEIKECINSIKTILNEHEMNDPKNSSVKAGFEKAVQIMKKRSTDFKKVGIEHLPTVQSKAIAMLAVDFVNGDVEKEALLNITPNIPLKEN